MEGSLCRTCGQSVHGTPHSAMQLHQPSGPQQAPHWHADLAGAPAYPAAQPQSQHSPLDLHAVILEPVRSFTALQRHEIFDQVDGQFSCMSLICFGLTSFQLAAVRPCWQSGRSANLKNCPAAS